VRQLPNLLTWSRILLTPLCVYLLVSGRPGLALPVTIVTGLTDTADGYLARRLGARTRLGAWMDPIADKLLLTSLYISFGIVNAAPVWLVWLVVGRDILILAMVAAGLAFTRIRDFPPTLWGKISTTVQIAGVLVLLAVCAGSSLAVQLQSITIWAVGTVTAWSGVHYIWRAFHMLRAS
jgi:cardiolipin synthase